MPELLAGRLQCYFSWTYFWRGTQLFRETWPGTQLAFLCPCSMYAVRCRVPGRERNRSLLTRDVRGHKLQHRFQGRVKGHRQCVLGDQACVRDAGRNQAGKVGLRSEGTRPTKGAHAQELSQSQCIAEPVNQNGGRGCSRAQGKGTALSPNPRAKQRKRERERAREKESYRSYRRDKRRSGEWSPDRRRRDQY